MFVTLAYNMCANVLAQSGFHDTTDLFDLSGGAECDFRLCMYSGIFHGRWRAAVATVISRGRIGGTLCDTYQKAFPNPSGGAQTF